MEDKYYEKELEKLVCFLSSCYFSCKKEYRDKHLHTCSISNKERRDLNDAEIGEIMRFPLIQWTLNNIQIEKLSKQDIESKIDIDYIVKKLINNLWQQENKK